MIRFDVDTVVLLHRLVCETSGGDFGVRDMGLLESAIESAYQTFEGRELYPTVEEKATRMGFALISNHAFVDGNKRIGVLVFLTFLQMSGVRLSITDEDIIGIGLGVASGRMNCTELLSWVKERSERGV